MTDMRSTRRAAFFIAAFAALALALSAGAALAADAVPAPAPAAAADTPAELVVTDKVVKPRQKVPPIGVNGWGGCGAVEWAANNFVHNAGNEPISWRNLHRAKECGENWFEIDGPGTSWWDLWNSGFLSGADLRIYRLVDKDGKPLPAAAEGGYLDLAGADHVVLVGKGRIIPEGSPGFPDGGWVANNYATPYPNASIRHGNLAATDASGLVNGRTYWYTVVAVGPDGQDSEIANEVKAAPAAGLPCPVRLTVAASDDKAPPLRPGAEFRLEPKVLGGVAPMKWQVVDAQGAAAALPEGLKLDPATGAVTGKCTAAPAEELPLRLKVTDAKGDSDVRTWLLNPKEPPVAPPGKAKPARAAKPDAANKPAPPTDVQAVAGDGRVTITWKPSPTAGVVGYRLMRSNAPKAEQHQRAYVTAETPKLLKWDYIVLERRFDPFDMRYVNPRVRGIGNPMNAPGWYWNGDLAKLSFSIVPHPQPVPPEMVDPGAGCMKVQAAEGPQTISQTVFIGTNHGGESLWYGQFEPGKSYRLEVWLRQEGLAGGGRVEFSYGKGYTDIKKDFQVTGQWARYTHEFTGPQRPVETWHFGHQFAFTGPGALWMDNCRIYRCDSPADADKPYVPNPTVLAELLAAQPAAGTKAAHRIWFLTRDATMDSILSWHAGSRVDVNWRTSVEQTMAMTVPMALTFDLATGKDPASRMRPWLVLQHVLHSEADWLAFIEYLAAPYDSKTDSPKSKPWAYRRWQQRGVGTPWTEEFQSIVVEFGNETWHNGVFDDWLGFRTRNAVHQGGREYGLFASYLIRNMKASPYWKACGLDAKIRFDLGANYDAHVQKDGRVTGYGEEAMQTCPEASVLGHANYAGPKWETGDYSARKYDDHGVQECLISFLTGQQRNQQLMCEAHEALARSGHDYDIAAYEGGPGGFALPGSAPPEQVETNERYGKSLAQGVGTFDAWMGSYAQGWTDQCYLGYNQGNYWASHTGMSDGFRPSPAWVVMALRNRFGGGDLLAVEQRGGSTLQRGKEACPLIGGYAMRDGKRWSVFVVSRKLDGKHDGSDFGDGTTPVKLSLPFHKAGKITLHKVTGDPRLTNRKELNIKIESQDVPASALKDGSLAVSDATGGAKGGMPGGSVFLYVFEDAE